MCFPMIDLIESGAPMSLALEDVYKPSDDVVAGEIEGEIISGPWPPAAATWTTSCSR